MHPLLHEIEAQLKNQSPALNYRFALACIEDVASNLEEDAAIQAFTQFKRTLVHFDSTSLASLQAQAQSMRTMAQSHPGSKSIDGTRHAAVSATYALAKAVEGDAVQAAAYAAYSSIYGYGGYAVNDPESFAEVHRKQLAVLSTLLNGLNDTTRDARNEANAEMTMSVSS